MSSGNLQNFKERLFAAKALDIEQIILETVQAYMLAPVRTAEMGDAINPNAVMEGLALNLDAFVSRILLSNKDVVVVRDPVDGKEKDYQTERARIILDWPKEGRAPIEKVRDLFKLTIEALSKERLFKMRRHVYFAVGFKKQQMPDLEELQDREEVEGIEEAGQEPVEA